MSQRESSKNYSLCCTVLHCTAVQSSVVTAVMCGVLQFAVHCTERLLNVKKIMLVIVLQQNICARVWSSRVFRMPINFQNLLSIEPHFALDCSSLLVCVPHRLIWNNFSIPVVYSNLYLNFLQIVPKLKKMHPRPILDIRGLSWIVHFCFPPSRKSQNF